MSVMGADKKGVTVVIDAEEEEPVLILKGRNPASAVAARAYADALRAMMEPPERVDEYQEFADVMAHWSKKYLDISPFSKLASDSYRKTNPQEPIFVLRGQDALAPAVVRYWIQLAKEHNCTPSKIQRAEEVAAEMEKWPHRKYPD